MGHPIFEASGTFGGLKYKVFGSVGGGRVGVGINKGVFTFCEFGSAQEASEFAHAILAAVADSEIKGLQGLNYAGNQGGGPL